VFARKDSGSVSWINILSIYHSQMRIARPTWTLLAMKVRASSFQSHSYSSPFNPLTDLYAVYTHGEVSEINHLGLVFVKWSTFARSERTAVENISMNSRHRALTALEAQASPRT